MEHPARPATRAARDARFARAARFAVVMLLAQLMATGCGERQIAPATPFPPSIHNDNDARGPTGFAQTNLTFYAAVDNDPPGSTEIAYPNERHDRAGGTGTFADPMTFATDPDELPPGTMIYYAPLRKYFVMEDQCAECLGDWKSARRPHIDLWVSSTSDPRVLACEESLTPEGLVDVEVNPPSDLGVDTQPLFDAGGRCWSPATH